MSKKTLSKTDRFLRLVTARPTSVDKLAEKLATSKQCVYDMAYRLRVEGHDIKMSGGRYSI